MDKQAIRERVWDDLEASGAARFPFPPHGRIPNFAGAGEAAERLAGTAAWDAAAVVKSNPDAPQRPVRKRALAGSKTVYMAVPRLRDEECFLRLDPAEIDDIDHATTISGSSEVGEPVGPDGMVAIDLVVAGSVAVTTDGARVGKGEGYSDLEYAVLREAGLVDGDTTVVTTVHDRQVVDADVPVAPHDVPIDIVVTPTRTIETRTPHSRPEGVHWDRLDDERLAEIIILRRLHAARDNA